MIKSAILFDFMVYAWKSVTCKLKHLMHWQLHLLKIFSYLSKDSSRIDTVCDIYLENTIKYGEIVRHQKAISINIVIESADQPLLVTMEVFWVSPGNKEQLQMFFINWLRKTYKDDKFIYLGG